MSLYDGIKDVARVVQKADNIELYQKLLDLSSQALDMQAEIERLNAENRQLRNNLAVQVQIIRHDEPYLTLEGKPIEEMYCATCYGKDGKLIQVRKLYNGSFECPLCKTTGVYDHDQERRSKERSEKARKEHAFRW